MSFIKDFSSLNVNETFKTLFPTVNEQGQIVFKEGDSLDSEENKRRIIDVFKRHIHSNEGTATAAAAAPEVVENSVGDRIQWFKLIEQIEEMSNNSSFCKELLNTVQNFVFGRICSYSEENSSVNISYKDIENSRFLQQALLEGSWEDNKGIIRFNTEECENIRKYLQNREHLERKSNLEELIFYHGAASFLGDDKGEEKIVLLIKEQLDLLSLEQSCDLFRCLPFGKIHHLLELRISALAPKHPQRAILDFFEKLYQDLGHLAKEIRSLHFDHSHISPKILARIVDLFPNLDEISLIKCKISDKNSKEIVKSLKKLEQLRSLYISQNQIGPAGAKELAALVNLQNLDISRNQIGPAGAKELAALVNLQSLDISRNQISDGGAKELAALVNLESLDVSHNQISDVGAKELAALVNLQSLHISSNQIGPVGAKELAALINLLKLDIGWNQINPAGIKELAVLVNLQNLDISGNKIGNVGVKELAPLQHLQTLCISSNQIGAAGVKELAALINLRKLDIGWNQIDPAGAKELAALVKLQSLDVSHNQIGPVGAKELADLVNLQSLNVSHNQISDAGAKELAALVNVQSLNISSNQIGDAGAKELAALINLRKLDIRWNEIGDAVAKELAALVNLQRLEIVYNKIRVPEANELSSSVHLRNKRSFDSAFFSEPTSET